ncbi:MAG: RAMP superfamily CRISPR-associated protein [Bacteroidota bacterium]
MPQQNYKLQIRLLSDALIGASEGFGAIIDKDSVFDQVGLPVIPGKRVKGILREQAEFLAKFGQIKPDIDMLFGFIGMTDKSQEYLSVGNFVLENYKDNFECLKCLISKGSITRSEVINHFTTLRMMTRIEDGIAADTSLRTIRVLKKGLLFTGDLIFDTSQLEIFNDVSSLTRRIGSMRNRGLGHIQCTLQDITSTIEHSKSVAI